ncbi:MAG TPA: hypothetical protein VG755_06370 [Nannocystaceae bacterium]|nr:hypothetical protein [Nannocystaceae bacterium]
MQSPAKRTFADAPKIVASADSQSIVAWRCFLIVIVHHQPSVSDVEAMIAEVARLKSEGVPHVGLIHVARRTPKLDPPPEPVRNAYRRLMNDKSTIVRASAVVVEQEGFFGSVVRSVVTSLSVLARPVYPTRALPDKPTAAAWVLAQLAEHDTGEPPATAFELIDAMEAALVLSDGAGAA